MKNIVYKVVILLLVLAMLALPLLGCDDFNLVDYELFIVSYPEKLSYYLGESVQLSGLKITLKNSLTGDTETISSFYGDERFTFSGYDNTTIGKKTVVVTCTIDGNSIRDSFEVEVVDVWLESAKPEVNLEDMVKGAYANAAAAYLGGANRSTDIENSLYLEIGSSKTDIKVAPTAVFAVGNTAKLCRSYFESGVENATTYTPIKQTNGKIYLAWATLMTTPFTIKVSSYDTKYIYSYPYEEQLQYDVVDGKYIAFRSKPAVDYCYVVSGSVMSVETIKRIISPVDRYCIEIADGTVMDDQLTVYVPGYAKLVVGLSNN